MDLTLPPLGTVLGVWAHPDDETLLAGGLMHLLARAGHRVVCATATRGERGTDDPQRCPPTRLARRRSRELAEALARLGRIEHHFLRAPFTTFLDGELPEVPTTVGRGAVRRVIEQVRPDTVITFGPDGFTGHRDHRTIGDWTGDAFAQAAADGARLLHVARTRHWWQDGPGGWIDVRMDRDDPALPHGVEDEDLAVDLLLRGDVLRRKVRALMAHRSQMPQLSDALGRDRFRDWVATEQFRLAAEKAAIPGQHELTGVMS